MVKNYDLIVVGAGPAGLTAAVYAARYKLDVLVIGTLVGGLASEAHEVCNFPTYNKILGFELASKMSEQVKALDVEIKQEEVLSIDGKDNNFKIKTNKEEYKAKKILLAMGSQRRKLNLEREKELTGRGISYCATCDAGFYQDKTAAVVGGGDAALTAALLLAKFAKKVYIIYRKEEFFRAEPTWKEEIGKEKKIEPVFDSTIEKLLGTEKLTGVEILRKGKKETLELDGIFVEIGSIPNTKLALELGVELDGKYIKTNKKQETNIPGVFSAGDITNNALKQVITACGEGATAADSAYREVESER